MNAEETPQTECLSVLNDAVCFDLTKYTIDSEKYTNDLFLNVIPQINIGYTLESNASMLKLLCSFTGENLHIIHVLERHGTAVYLTKASTSTIEMAKIFLNGYQNVSKNPFYGQLGLMLDKLDAKTNATFSSGNVKLKVTNSANNTNFVWSYVLNTVDVPRKCVALSYKDGFFESFVDTWNLYQLGSTTVNLSEAEAIDIAFEQIKPFSWEVDVNNTVTARINKFNVTKAIVKNLVFYAIPPSGAEDHFTLYPMWRIGLGLDKFYPGNVYGLYVDVWADTKELRAIQTVSSSVPIPENNIASMEDCTTSESISKISEDEITSNSIIPGVALITVILGIIPVCVFKRKPPKNCYRLIVPTFMCFLISISILLTPVLVANATNHIGCATTWGSLAPVKELTEINLQGNATDYIEDKFSSNGYDATDYQGINSMEAILLPTIDSSEANYPRVATVWFDHGIGLPLDFPGYDDEWHFRIIDSNTTEPEDPEDELHFSIFDYEIYDKTSRGKTFFAFISTCMSAKLDLLNPLYGTPLGNGSYGANSGGSGEIIGMPYAWTHGASLNIDGYDNPDDGEFCYIGFPYGSPSLDQDVDPEDYPGVKYYDWVLDFFKYALDYDMTIHQALDHASQECFPPNYLRTTDLYHNFSAVWPGCFGDEPFPNCTMKVYGNGDLKLYQPLLTVNACDSSGNPLTAGVEIDGEYVGTTSAAERVFATFSRETHNITVTEPNGYDFQNFTVGYSTYVRNPVNISVEYDLTVTAYFTEEPHPQQVPVTFVIDSTAVGDQYGRFHAFTVDNPIPTVFWSGDWYNQNPGAIIGVTGGSLHYETTKYLTEGYHNIEYAVSSYVGYWSVTITANGQQVISQSTGVYNHATTQILVTDDPPPPPTYTLSISSTQGGYTDPSGSPQYQSGTYANVQAYANQGWSFAYWLLDGNNAGSNPSISVYMDTNHNLQAVFAEDVQYYTVNIFAYEDYYMGTVYAPFYIDGEYVGTTPYTTSLPEGNHVFSFESPIYDYPYTFIRISQNPQTVYINQYTEVTAIYTFN